MVSESELERIEVRLVVEAIHQRYGYDLRGYNAGTLTRRVRAALAKSGLSHLGELQHELLSSSEFFHALLDDLLVQVSDFFRDAAFFAAFKDEVVPQLRSYPEIKLWVAGCAFGEEVYSVAVLLSEAGLYERTQIYATDISSRALEQARHGVYAAGGSGSMGDAYAHAGGTKRLEDYYSIGYDNLAFRESLKRNLVFFQHDLTSDHALGEMHVILCRNVLIYFGSALRDRVFAMFADSLCRGGFLCLGASESLSAEASRAFLDFSPSQRIYRRRGTQ